ncbi:hypothetical protein CEXT_551621 [Caerostris extrusa]|uniref:Uncharacterized protein n=1 Tax=Caerostris extrusa TaxID=172846 RepID=A0AAV4T0S2_CAEEX|nr:hypothetical protein CEXT_551621 [Caerostris extrusa]
MFRAAENRERITLWFALASSSVSSTRNGELTPSNFVQEISGRCTFDLICSWQEQEESLGTSSLRWGKVRENKFCCMSNSIDTFILEYNSFVFCHGIMFERTTQTDWL